MPRSEFKFQHDHRVRWAECDPQGIVFHGRFLTFFDITQTEYLRHIGFPYPGSLKAAGVDFVLIKATLECLGSALFDDEIEILARVARVGRTSLTFGYEIYRRGEERLLTRCESVYVCVGAEDFSSTPLPEPLVEAIRRHEQQGGDEVSV
jgi:acyl-CoA thioester hydrolase